VSKERRKYVRIPDSSPVSYKVIPEEKISDYVAKDISQGGLRFFVHEFIPKDSLLKVRVTLSETTFSFEAVVKLMWINEVPYSDKYEVGVEFVNLPKESTEYLIDYIRTFFDFRGK